MSKHPRSMVLTIIFLTAVCLVSAITWFLIYHFQLMEATTKTPSIEFWLELSKALLQLSLVSLLGATASFLYGLVTKEMEQRRARRQENDKLRHELLESVVKVRSQVEKARRSFRLEAGVSQQAAYVKAIQEILDARLQLSDVWHDMETLRDLFPDHEIVIKNHLAGMKTYLDRLVDEYERKPNAFSPDREADSTAVHCPCAQDFNRFVTGDGGPDYAHGFLEKEYRPITRIMRTYILQASTDA